MNPGIHVTSPATKEYNCIAWAAGDDKRFWWPLGGYWPSAAPRQVSLEAFTKVFSNLGYEKCNNEKCNNGDLEGQVTERLRFMPKPMAFLPMPQDN